jgi:hypothetical protein
MKKFSMPSGGDVAKNAAVAWGKQKGFDLIRPAVKALVRTFPGLAIDTPHEKIAAEIAATLPGIMESFLPNQDMLVNVVGDITREVLNELKAASEGAGRTDNNPPQGERRVPMKPRPVWLNNRAKPGEVVLGRCLACHTVDSNGKRIQGYNVITDFEDVVRANLQAPVGVPDCICGQVLAEELAALQPPKVEAKDASAKDSRPPSFATLLGRALNSKDSAVAAKAEGLRQLIAAADLKPKYYDMLEQCDTSDELTMLMTCQTENELLVMLPTLVAKEERGAFGRVGHEAGLAVTAAKEVWTGINKAAVLRAAASKKILSVAEYCRTHGTNRQEVVAILKPEYPDVNEDNLNTDGVDIVVKPNQSGVILLDEYRNSKQLEKNRKNPAPSKWQKFRRILWG